MQLLIALAAAAAAASPAAPAATASVIRTTDVPAIANGSPPMKQDMMGDPDQVICRNVVTTGSHFTTKDCRSRAEWNQLTADSRQTTLELTSRYNGFSN